MLPLEHRLKKNSEFAEIIRLGTKVKFGPLLFFYQPSGQVIRFGIVVSKRVSKLAVDRNRAKRIIRAVLNNEKARWINRTGAVVIMVQALPQADEHQEFLHSVDSWLKKQFSD